MDWFQKEMTILFINKESPSDEKWFLYQNPYHCLAVLTSYQQNQEDKFLSEHIHIEM